MIGATLTDGFRDCRGGLDGVVVLPEAEREPPRLREPPIGIGVARLVARDLRVPVILVRAGRLRVFRASVPPAAVHVNGNPSAPEHEIGCTPQIRQGTGRDPES